MEQQVQLVTVSEDDLFRLAEYVDSTLETSQRFKDDGVLLFDVADGSGKGTSLDEFMMKYRDGLEDSLKRLNPIRTPQNKEFYGHIAISSQNLAQEEVESCIAVLDQPSEYSVQSSNCCMSALNEQGVAGILSHYFDETLPAHASYPPQFLRFESLSKLRKKGTAKSKTFKKTKDKVDSKKSVTDKAALMSQILDNPKHQKDDCSSYCTCWMCIYSDEVLVEEKDGSALNPGVQETADYYRGKGFMYANGVNVAANKRNRISTNFSLSFLNNLTVTNLLEGFFPGINSPYLYFGFTHSFAPIHIEDLSLWSVNFLHHGYPKLWIVVPPSSVAKLQYFLSKEFTYSGHGSCIGLLGHKYHFPSYSWLDKNGIPYKVVLQQSGQGVIVAPNAAHMVVNLGPNVAEAINFGSKYWVPFGIVYPKCTCMAGQVHADLSTIISSFAPEMLPAYLHQKIPRTKSQADFTKCIVVPQLFEEAFEASASVDVGCPTRSSDDHGVITVQTAVSEADDSGVNVPMVRAHPKRLKRVPNRKDIICPVCSKVYQGGKKKRLLHHVSTAHSNLPDDESRRVDSLLKSMFPEWGAKYPKKICPLCGKAVARTMSAHQQSTACVLRSPS